MFDNTWSCLSRDARIRTLRKVEDFNMMFVVSGQRESAARSAARSAVSGGRLIVPRFSRATLPSQPRPLVRSAGVAFHALAVADRVVHKLVGKREVVGERLRGRP